MLDRLGVKRRSCRPHRAYEVKLSLGVDRLAQSADMHIDGARLDMDIVTPDRVQQLLTREHATGMLHLKNSRSRNSVGPRWTGLPLRCTRCAARSSVIASKASWPFAGTALER